MFLISLHNGLGIPNVVIIGLDDTVGKTSFNYGADHKVMPSGACLIESRFSMIVGKDINKICEMSTLRILAFCCH